MVSSRVSHANLTLSGYNCITYLEAERQANHETSWYIVGRLYADRTGITVHTASPGCAATALCCGRSTRHRFNHCVCGYDSALTRPGAWRFKSDAPGGAGIALCSERVCALP